MSRRWIGVARCLVGLGLVAVIAAFAASREDRGAPSINPVRLSRASGFYDEAFDLELYCDAGEIHYTLDSTDPDENSPLYTGPIRIDDASANDNVYSALKEVSLDLNEDILERYGRSAKYGTRVPGSPVDKATVVRAICIDALGKQSRVETGVFFVGFGEKKGYSGVNVVTITTDPSNLFDYERGIYVMGKTFDRSAAEGFGEAAKDNYWFWPANYTQKGDQWERRATITFFDRERNQTVSGDFGIRIQGRGSRGKVPRSLNIYARERYGTPSVSGQALFGVDYSLNRLNLSSGANGMDTLMTDYLVNELASGMAFETRPYEPYALFLDGEYWGMYWLTPRYKKDYFEGVYHLSGDDMVAIKYEDIDLGDEEDYRGYQDMVDFIAGGDMSDPAQYARACELIDIQSCIDYYAVEIYIANQDWPNNNFALWRTRTVSDRPGADGKWRWMLYDVNLSMKSSLVRQDLVQRAACRDTLFCSLLDNPDFEAAMESRLAELAVGCFAPERVDAFIDGYEAMMADAMENEYNRFYDGERTRQDFLEACEDIRTFFHDRQEYITEAYGDQ